MKIYDEITKQELTSPDLSKGYVYDGVRVTGRTQERYEVVESTVTETRPEGLTHLIPAQDITEPCQWYHTYTEEELAQQTAGRDLEQRLAALEEELAATKILLGVE